MFRQTINSIYLFCFLTLGLYGQEELCTEELLQPSCEQLPQECFTLDVPQSVTRALNYNRPLFNNFDNKLKAEYALLIAESEFNIRFNPNSRAGYVGGGRDGLGWSVGGGIDICKKFEYGTSITVSPLILKTPEHYHTTLKATIAQPLLRGFGKDYQLSRVRGAKFNLRSVCRSLFTAQIQLVTRTVQSLYEVVKAKKSVEINEASFLRVKRFYQAAKLKEKIGLSDGLDVYRAEIEMQQAEDTLTTSLERLQETEDTLKDILAYPLDICVKVDVPMRYTHNDICEEEAIKIALENRIEMDQAIDQWRENYRLSRVSKERLVPDVDIVFDYSNCGKNEFFTRSCTGRRESTWGVGLATSGDFDPIGDRLAYEESLSAISTASRGIDQTKATITLEVKKALRQLQRAYKRILLQEEQIKTSEGQLHLAQLKFERSMANNFDVIQAEKTFQSSQVAYWSAIIDHIVGEYQFLAAIGRLTDKPCIK